MGTLAVPAAAHAPFPSRVSVRDIPARFRELAGVMVAQMLNDDDELPKRELKEPDDSYPSYLAGDPLALRAEYPALTGPGPGQADDESQAATDATAKASDHKHRRTPRHAAPAPTLAAKLSHAKPRLPGFAPRSSHAAW